MYDELVGAFPPHPYLFNLVLASIPKMDVESHNFRYIDKALEYLCKVEKKGLGKLMLSFAGYANVEEEVFEILEIRNYASKLVEKYPHIFFFITPVENNINTFFCCLCDVQSFKDLSYSEKPFSEIFEESIRSGTMPAAVDVKVTSPPGLYQQLVSSARSYALENKVSIKAFEEHIEHLGKYYL